MDTRDSLLRALHRLALQAEAIGERQLMDGIFLLLRASHFTTPVKVLLLHSGHATVTACETAREEPESPKPALARVS